MKMVAALLAIGGTIYGFLILFLLLLMLPEFEWEFLVYFGSICVLTAGYWVRALMTPPLWGRYLIWGLALFVQGASLGYLLWHSGLTPPQDRLDVLGLSWLAGTLILSALALCVEHKRRNSPPASRT